jgi:hypothetical protein
MGLFTTTSRRTYRAKRARTGYSTTVKAKTRLKRWAKRRTKQLWRKAKARIRQRPTARRNRQIARTAQQFRQHNANIHTQVQGASGTLPGQVKMPPPDGATSTCRRCSNDVVYNAGRGRWEHPGRGHYECFQPHR